MESDDKNMKTIFFDLDDTLLDVHSKQIDPSSMEIIQPSTQKAIDWALLPVVHWKE